jgi:cytochrome c biogenesis protein CcmG/thiol:disulfide interchange protein DsbE
MSTNSTDEQDADVDPAGGEPVGLERTSASSGRRVGTRTIVLAALVALCVAAGFTLVALRQLSDVSVDPANALQDLAVVPAVPEGTTTAVVGEPAPTVTLDYLDGGRQELGELRGTPVLINFWSSTCAPCVQEMPLFQDVSERAGDQLHVVGVDVTDTAAGAAEQIRRTGVTYRNADDPRGELFATFAGTALPRTVLLGADGTVLEMVGGALDAAGLADLLRRNGVDAG